MSFPTYVPTPTQERELWRIVQPYKLESLLSGDLWFVRIDSFGDPREGDLPTKNLGLLAKGPKYASEWLTNEYAKNKLISYAICLTRSDCGPKQYLWDHFSKPEETIAIRTSVAAVNEAISPFSKIGMPVQFGNVEYIDHSTETIVEDNLIRAVYTVDKEWEKECEARVLLYLSGTVTSNLYYSGTSIIKSPIQRSRGHWTGTDNHRKAIIARIDPEKFIHEIRLHPRMSPNDRILVLGIISRFNMKHKLRP